jgi:hypothetical protein
VVVKKKNLLLKNLSELKISSLEHKGTKES